MRRINSEIFKEKKLERFDDNLNNFANATAIFEQFFFAMSVNGQLILIRADKCLRRSSNWHNRQGEVTNEISIEYVSCQLIYDLFLSFTLSTDGEPIKLLENLESLPRADHFPTQRHRWNTNEVSFRFKNISKIDFSRFFLESVNLLEAKEATIQEKKSVWWLSMSIVEKLESSKRSISFLPNQLA